MSSARAITLASLLILCAVAPVSSAAELPPVEPGFTRIFNGENLAGWKVVNGKTGSWRVRDGVLQAKPGGNWIVHEKPLGDFILRLDWKVSKDGNSGVFVRVPTDTSNEPWNDGFEAQISNAPRDIAHCTGSLYGVVGVDKVLARMSRDDWHVQHEAPDVWHSYEIACLGNNVMIRIDNVECVNARYDRVLSMRTRPVRGFIGLQDSHAGEGSYVAYKNIRVAELSPEGLIGGFERLSYSANEFGWHKIHTGHGNGGRWRMIDDAWVGEQDPPGSGNGGVLLTDTRYQDFELSIETYPDWGCCSGIFLRSTEKGQCYQIMVDHHGRGNVGSIYGEGTGGFSNRNYSFNPAKEVMPNEKTQGNIPFPITPEEWSRRWNYKNFNEIRARIVGNPPTIKVWVNGVYITRFRDDQVRTQLDVDGKGSVGIQVHGGKDWPNGWIVRYRNVQVRRL